jgi:hypothetical protein
MASSGDIGLPLTMGILEPHRSSLDGTPPCAETDGMGTGYAQKILFFFCRKCGDYHEKTHPEYMVQKTAFLSSPEGQGSRRATASLI